MRTTISLTVLMLMSFVLSGCGRGPAATTTPEADSLQALHNDSLIWLAKSTADKERAFYVIDSIERAGGIGPIRANYERGNVCRQLKEQRQSEDYWKTAVGTDIKGKAEEKAYYKAVAYLANWLQAKHDFEGALRVAIPAVARMKQSGVASYTSIGIHMGDMGICHQKMNRNAEADRCFEESYDYMKKAVATDTSQYAIENALIILNNTTLFCMDARRYDKALHWSACVDSMLQAYRQNPNANQRVLALQEARRLNCLACILLGQGKKKEAEELSRIASEKCRFLAIPFTYSGFPMVKLARDLVAKGELGAICKVVLEYQQGSFRKIDFSKPLDKRNAWKMNPKKSGPSCVVADIGVHGFHLIEHVTGLQVKEVIADLSSFAPGNRLDDDASMLLRLSGGAKASFVVSKIATGEENGVRLRVYGDKASLFWNQEENNYLSVKYPFAPERIYKRNAPYVRALSEESAALSRIPAGHHEGFIEAFANIYREFCASVRDRKAHDFPGPKEGVRTMRFVEAALRSAAPSNHWEKI